ncbi:hypothetical protein AJ79_02754 [Helicocarpus griseus UAMH5409]|uniref:DUF2406 domain-containing protein n=1 Tax=Helicocarpus griseus UAMH5409 TaxID=1447875 RepID=A0A2B7Y1H3_9EURO|nr:hypothetical protein AJ79_02754 [Helicocarpus griseus UAMH5409]
MAVQGQEVPRRPRVLSFHSNKSEKTHKSSGSHTRIDLSETHKEKEANRMHTYADPTRAMQELQPSVIALQKSTLESLRNTQHKDIYGNPITEPDLSNPTRHRFERPLDTIRSFEAAIDGNYSNRRGSYARPDESTNGGYSRRSSYFGGDRGGAVGGPSYQSRGYNEHANYSSHRNQSRPDSYVDSYGGGGSNPYGNGHYNNNNNNYQQRPPRYGGRMNHDQQMHGYYNNQPSYPPNGNVASSSGSGSGNHSSDQLADYTDPSSLNSSTNGVHQQQLKQQDQVPADTYGFNGFGGAPELDYSQPASNGYYQDPPSNGFQNGGNYTSQAFATPSVPPKDTRPNVSSGPAVMRKAVPPSAPSPEKKKKGIFKRFSKS